MIRQGIKTKDVNQGMNMFFWIAMAGFAEMALRRASKELIALLTGEDLDDWEDTIVKENVINTLQNVPVISQGVSLYNYGTIPVPAFSYMQRMTTKLQTLKRTKDSDKRLMQTLELLILVGGTTAGLPGTEQLAEILRSEKRS